jgi:hypothetical protein
MAHRGAPKVEFGSVMQTGKPPLGASHIRLAEETSEETSEETIPAPPKLTGVTTRRPSTV